MAHLKSSILVIVWLLLALLATALAVTFWAWVPYIVAGGLVLAFAVWILVSVLSPAIPDRTCPGCNKDGLVKIRRGVPGVRCEFCGFVDENMHVAYLDEW